MIVRGPTYIKGEIVLRTIKISEGRISSIERGTKTSEDVMEWDGVILPAGTDMHVHFRDPGNTDKEDFYTGTLAAAYGGITTVADMPNNYPTINSVKRLKKKKKNCGGKACVDYALYGLISSDIENMMDVTSLFKVYLSPTTNIDPKDMKDEYVEEALESGCLVAFHCEDGSLFKDLGDDLPSHNMSRPVESEVKAIRSLKRFEDRRKHICHITSSEGSKLARRINATTEVTPHHLVLMDEALLGPYGKVNPPLRDNLERLSLCERVQRGEIDVIASDHAPHIEKEKAVDFKDAPSGIPGVETMYPLLMHSVAYGDLSLDTMVKSVAERPAEILGTEKGFIEEGKPADLVLFDFRAEENINSEKLHSKCGWSPFEGFRAIFPTHVISRGEWIIEDRKFTGKKGRGKYLG